VRRIRARARLVNCCHAARTSSRPERGTRQPRCCADYAVATRMGNPEQRVEQQKPEARGAGPAMLSLSANSFLIGSIRLKMVGRGSSGRRPAVNMAQDVYRGSSGLAAAFTSRYLRGARNRPMVPPSDYLWLIRCPFMPVAMKCRPRIHQGGLRDRTGNPDRSLAVLHGVELARSACADHRCRGRSDQSAASRMQCHLPLACRPRIRGNCLCSCFRIMSHSELAVNSRRIRPNVA